VNSRQSIVVSEQPLVKNLFAIHDNAAIHNQ